MVAVVAVTLISITTGTLGRLAAMKGGESQEPNN